MDDTIARLNAALDGRYRIERDVGVGGMATVYAAADLRHDRTVALKVLNPDLTALVAGKRFLGEITTTANLHHPHILPLFDSGQADGLLYYVMPYVRGESLRARLDREGELPIDEAVRIAIELAGALDYAHREGVVHRDIKPGNVLLQDGHGFLSDFGIALALSAAAAERDTGSGHVVGTPHYMSPEQAAPTGAVDARSDVYALACVLHEMLTGEPVFSGATARAILAKHLTVPPVPASTLRSSVPRGVEQAILRALEKSPADRFQTTRDFAAALEHGVRPRTPLRGMLDAAQDHPIATTAAGLVAAGTTAILLSVFVQGPAWTVRPESVVVLPFRESGSTAEEAELATRLAGELARELQAWDGLRVATGLELAGPRGDLGLEEVTLERVGDGAALARALGAQAVLTVAARRAASDSVYLEASLVDARSSRRVGDPITVGARLDQLEELRVLAPVVAGVLGFGDAPEAGRALRAGTRDPDAAEAYLDGRAALAQNRLDAAQESLERALRLDSTFVTALSFLAQVHFWRGVEDNYYFLSRSSDISRPATEAMRSLSGLSAPNAAHARGFFALQLGVYDEARDHYRTVIEADSTDMYARVMLGVIELIDPWSVRDGSGRLVTRSNLNRARRAFSEAVRIDPTFELAYGQMFEIRRRLEGGLRMNCDGFEELGEEERPIWQRRVPSATMYAACPAALDSLAWIPLAEFGSIDRSVLQAGTDRYFRLAVGELERWASFAPDQPRPLELLSEAYLLQREQSGVAAPERHRALAAQALRYRSEALGLQADTTPGERVELANLHLAVGDLDVAVEHARGAMGEYAPEGGRRPIAAPPALLNVLITSGQIASALDVATGSVGYFSSPYAPDPDGGAPIPAAGGRAPIVRLRVMGASGLTGPMVAQELEHLEQAWLAEGYSERALGALYGTMSQLTLPILALDPVALEHWSRRAARDDALWRALTRSASDPEAALEALSEAAGSSGHRDVAVETFALALTAGGLGSHELAVSLFSRLDSIPALAVSFDSGWGLRALSHLLRAGQYERLGAVSEAVEHYRAFIRVRSWPDALAEPGLAHARERLDFLERN